MTAPVANPLTLSGDEDTLIAVNLDASDADFDVLTYEIVDGPQFGSVDPLVDGFAHQYVYTPGLNYNGADSFTYRVFDGVEYSATVTVDITVDSVADMPVVEQVMDQPVVTAGPVVGEGDQIAIAALPSGGYVVVRHDYNEGSTVEELILEIFDSGGNSGPILVNPVDDGYDPSVSVLQDGTIQVAWTAVNSAMEEMDIRVRHFAADGTPLSPATIVNMSEGVAESLPDIAIGGPGHPSFIAWQGDDSIETHIYARTLDTSGAQGSTFQIDEAVGFSATNVSFAMLANGTTWVATWMEDSASGWVVNARFFDGGAALGNTFTIGSAPAQTTVAVLSGNTATALVDGGFAVAWAVSDDPMVVGGVHISLFDGDGTGRGSEIVIPGTAGEVSNISMTAIADGFVVAWQDVGSGSDDNIFVQRYDLGGNSIGAIQVVDPAGLNQQADPAIVALASGGVLIAYAEQDPIAIMPDALRTADVSLTTHNVVMKEGSTLVNILPLVSVTDADTTTLNSLTVGFAGETLAGDMLSVNTGASSLTASYNTGSHTLVISGTATLEEYQDVLTTLQLQVADGGLTSTRLLQIVAFAGDGNSAAMLETITVVTTDQTVSGGGVNDTLYGGNGNDTLDGGDGFDTLVGNAGNDYIAGGNNRDYMEGGDGDDTLSGGSGADTMIGGNGDDIYFVNTASDAVVEDEGLDIDTVYSSTDFTMPNYVEVLRLTGSANINAFGMSYNDTLMGNVGNNSLDGSEGDDGLYGLDGNDTLNGGSGNDTLFGGNGDDRYEVTAGDFLYESANVGGGTDTIVAATHWTLGANFENLELADGGNYNGLGNTLNNLMTGNGQDNSLSGLFGDDTIYGGDGNDTLNGGDGLDVLNGGNGNDTYIVKILGDLETIVEEVDGGIDTVRSWNTYTLGAGSELENIVLMGSDTIGGYGNELDNAITGNGYSNTLSGGEGNDTLAGGGGSDYLDGGNGNDTYYADSDDTVYEALDSGIDTVHAYQDYSLGSNVENLVLTGNGVIAGYGNSLDNALYGNIAGNYLNGGVGRDTISGGNGNDSIAGGTQVDWLYGGNDHDTLDGGDAADWLFGGYGNDLLIGGNGNDQFIFNIAPNSEINQDDIADFTTGDRLRLDDAVFASLTLGALSAGSLAYGTAALDADDFLVYDSSTGDLFYDADADGAGSAELVVTLNNQHALVASDILIV